MPHQLKSLVASIAFPAANMDLAMRNADFAGFAARRREAEARGKLLGLGLANYGPASISPVAPKPVS